ncbi:MAG: GNAT family N-acetyltransferase [Promethearchaeati archaeon SRVP18_Atabeyarchaeia-1]
MLPRAYDLAKSGQGATIREAVEADFSEIWGIYSKVLNEGLYTPSIRDQKALDRNNHPGSGNDEESGFLTLLCEIDGEVVGYASIEESVWDLSKHVGELGIAILPKFRGIGVGSALLDSLLRFAYEKGFEKMTLSVFHTNRHAIRLYRKFGFKEVGRKKRQFNLQGHYIDEIIMERFLA